MGAPKQLGKYFVTAVLGTGAMSIVYAGYDASLDRMAAIKTLRRELLRDEASDEILERFRQEALIMARLRHENFVMVYEFVEDGDPPFMAMELIEAKTLSQHLNDAYPFTSAEIYAIMKQLLAALEYLHGQPVKPVIHRDIKPANLFWVPGGQLKVADFGVARTQSSTLTRHGSAIGTPAYMSPEQFAGGTVDSRSDLWSTGVILYELLTGARCFSGDFDAVRGLVLTGDPLDPLASKGRSIPAPLRRIVRKALAKDPAERFQTAAEFSVALDAACRDDSAARTRLNAKWSSLLASRKAAAGLLLAIIVAIAIGVVSTLVPSIDEGKIGEILARSPCSELNYALHGTKVEVSGYVESEQDGHQLEAALKQLPHVSTVLANLNVRAWPYCEVLPILAPHGKARVPSAADMRIRVKNLAGQLAAGEFLVLDLVSPAYGAYGYVDYYQLDGNVVHLLPYPVDKPQLYAAASHFNLGDPASGNVLQVESPFGQEMVVMLAAEAPLFASARPRFEPAREYLPALRSALASARQTRVAADYLFVQTKP